MAKNSVRDYSATNSDNTDIQSIDISEGCSPAGINNAIREVMVDLKNVSTGAVALESPAFDSASLTGDLTFGDNDKAVFGAGSDLQIYHDGSGSFVDEQGTGGLILRGTNLFLRSSTNENYLGAVADGAVDLYYDNASKLATTSTGVDVVGTAKSDIVQLDAGSAPTWDTNTRLWTESGFGARYDGYQHRFDVGVSRTEAMRIDSSGTVIFGASSTVAPSLSYRPDSSGGYIEKNSNSTGATTAYDFKINGTRVGSITTSGSSTAYNTSSDYRLKENVVADWDATTRLKQLNPVRFNFISDADTTVDGFIAHEAQAVVPECVSGTKDEVDDDGNPVYQGIDQSKLVPLLVKTIQELEARITALEAV